MRHLRQNAAPDSLVKLGVARTPADRTKSSAVIFGIGYSYTYTSSRLVTDDGRCHSSSKAGDTVRLAIKGILSSVIFWCIDGQSSGNSRADDFFVCTDPHGRSNLRAERLKHRIARRIEQGFTQAVMGRRLDISRSHRWIRVVPRGLRGLPLRSGEMKQGARGSTVWGLAA